MTPSRFAVLLVASTLAFAPLTLSARATDRAVYVSVLNEQGQPVTTLGPADFIVREDGVQREILSVRPATDPLQIAILVDNTQAATHAIQDMRRALTRFIEEMTDHAEI